MNSKRRYRGVHPIVPTAFHPDGSLDLASMERLTRFLIEREVDGVALLGFMGEAHKMTTEERGQVVDRVASTADGRLIVWVGVRALGTAGAVEQVLQAEALGADAVFVAPLPSGSELDQERHFREVAASTHLPIAIHDYPAEFGVRLSASLIARLANDGVAPYVKAEDPPVLVKQRRLLADTNGAIGVFGGLGGQWAFEELVNGAAGIMTGLAFPEVLVGIYKRLEAGDVDGARELFDGTLPLIRYEFQPGIGVGLRKHVLVRRGVFSSAYVRPPGQTPDDATLAEFESVARRVGIDIALPAF
jgi:4-hydroxy-tetrahydrodipicolinate synthase